jgi:hypothetical protein
MSNWTEDTDAMLKSALAAAANALGVANAKIQTYSQAAKPTGGTYAVGDMWFDSDDKNKPYRWNGTDFVPVQDTHLDDIVTTHTAQIKTNADSIALKADQTTVTAQGQQLESLSAQLAVVPGQINAAVSDGTAWVNDDPPPLAGLYEGKFWHRPSTGNQYRWKAIVSNNALNYPVSLSGVIHRFNDLSDNVALGVTVKTVAAQSGSGTPSPTNIRPFIVRTAIEAWATGRNQCPTYFSDWETGHYAVDGTKQTTAERVRLTRLIPVSPSTQYYLHAFTDPYRFVVRMYDGYGAFVGSIGAVVNGGNFITGSTVRYIGVSLFNSTSETGMTYAIWQSLFSAGTVKPFISLYSEADKTYEEFGRESSMPVPQPMYGLSGHEDETGNDGHAIYATAIRTILGTESITFNAQLTNTIAVVVNNFLVDYGMETPVNMLCSHFPLGTSNGDASDVEHVRASTGVADVLVLYLNKSRISGWSDAWTNQQKADAVKAWLKAQSDTGTPVQVVHKLLHPASFSGPTNEVSLTGTEAWLNNATYAVNGYHTFYTTNKAPNAVTRAAMSTHLPFVYANTASAVSGVHAEVGGVVVVRVPDSIATTPAALNAWLLAQIAAGKPVKVRYQTTGAALQTPINGKDGVNIVTGDGPTVSVSYVGSGWALVSGTARRLYAGAGYKWDENGEEITMTSIDGKPVDTKYIASAQKYGIFRVIDGKLLQGAKMLADGRMAGASSVIVDPDGDDNSYFEVKTSDGGVHFTMVAATHDGPGPTDEPDFGNVPITAWRALIGLGAYVSPSWVPGEYSDEIYTELDARGTTFYLYGDQLYFAAIDPATGNSKCGISFDAERDSAGRIWGTLYTQTLWPDTSGQYNIGNNTRRYKQVWVTIAESVSSDERLKQDIAPIQNASALLNAIPAYQFRLKSDPSKLHYGSTWQAVKAALIEMGILDAALVDDGTENDDEMHALIYTEMIGLLLAGHQEQQRTITEQRARLDAQQQRIDDLERKLNELADRIT